MKILEDLISEDAGFARVMLKAGAATRDNAGRMMMKTVVTPDMLEEIRAQAYGAFENYASGLHRAQSGEDIYQRHMNAPDRAIRSATSGQAYRMLRSMEQLEKLDAKEAWVDRDERAETEAPFKRIEEARRKNMQYQT